MTTTPCHWFGTQLLELIGDEDPERANRAMRAMLTTGKIIVADIRKAAAG